MDFAKQEEKIIRFWRGVNAFEKSVSLRSKKRNFVFFEGPPTANGRPGIHHVEARSFKDAINRYKTMKGYRVERKAGWDTQGLPVELAVEKSLGLSGKKDIEEYGIARFNAACRKSVWQFKGEWENLTERMGFWVDMQNPYVTYDSLYIETLWWIVREIWKRGFLYEGHKVVPYCPRCETALSSHEVAQGYQDVVENSVFVKFLISNSQFLNKLKIDSSHTIKGSVKREKTKVYLLAWTTTPWTLPGNAALAVGPKIEYSAVTTEDEIYIVASDFVSKLQKPYEVLKSFQGKELVGMEYEPPFDSLKGAKEKKHYVVSASFVTTEEGTGIVHIAPMYGEDDYNLGVAEKLPLEHTVNPDGTFNAKVPEFKGMFVKKAEPLITADLKKRGLAYREERHKHSYPFCWRCGTALLYYATDAWFVAMRKLQKELILNNKKVNWTPSYLKEGRFGEWLKDVKDWTLSRSRYWGTPLPIWKCEKCGEVEVIGSRADLGRKTAGKNTYFVLRHGEATKNVSKTISFSYIHGERYPLTAKGKKDALLAARKLKKLGGVDVIFSSPIRRTRETAELIGKEFGIAPKYDKRLSEYVLGDFEGKKEALFLAAIPKIEDQFLKKLPGGETLADVQKRMREAIDEIEKKHHGKKILIVSHGDPLWVLESALIGLTRQETVLRRKNNYPRTGEVRTLEYGVFPYSENGDLDLHRPYVDDIVFACTSCRSQSGMHRVKDVADVWFDSGSMPFAQWHYPFQNQNKIDKKEAFPADFISEAVDQTRGWFYLLLAISTVLGKGPAYKNVISLGHVVDTKGQKMSKSKGNIVDPWDVMEKYSADALRWYFYTVNDPGDVKRFDEKDIKEKQQKYIATLWNSLLFLTTYKDAKFTGSKKLLEPKAKNVLDIWALARWAEARLSIEKMLDSYDVVRAARMLEQFVIEDLSNWYIRRSRRRFQHPERPKEKDEATSVLYYLLYNVALYTAPFTPFIAEAIFGELTRGKKRSVHWEILPKTRQLKAREKKIIAEMERLRGVVAEGLRLRGEAGLRVRQPLAAIFLKPNFVMKKLQPLILEELNVKEVIEKAVFKKSPEVLCGKTGGGGDVCLDIRLTENLLREGLFKELVRNVQDLRKTAGLSPQHKISLRYSLPDSLRGHLKEFEGLIAEETNAKKVSEERDKGKALLGEASFAWQGSTVWVGIKKKKI